MGRLGRSAARSGFRAATVSLHRVPPQRRSDALAMPVSDTQAPIQATFVPMY